MCGITADSQAGAELMTHQQSGQGNGLLFLHIVAAWKYE